MMEITVLCSCCDKDIDCILKSVLKTKKSFLRGSPNYLFSAIYVSSGWYGICSTFFYFQKEIIHWFKDKAISENIPIKKFQDLNIFCPLLNMITKGCGKKRTAMTTITSIFNIEKIKADIIIWGFPLCV